MTTAETHTFQAETRQLLDLMIHSLYSHREIFLRELISNASDALDKLRLAALTDDALRDPDHRAYIFLDVDAEARTLSIEDSGIGMSRDEVVQNIGTIARSGTREFAAALGEASKEPSEQTRAELIGQFGVGFYSSFMVADKVVLETRKAGSEQGTRWTSTGDGEYTLEDCEVEDHGTTITLHLKPVPEEADGEFQDFTEEWVLRQVVKRYSDFVAYPIEMEVERTKKDDDGNESTETEAITLNSQKPLWTRSPADISEEEYTEFYHHVSRDWGEPLETIHFKAEGTHEYTALLYLPRTKPFDMLDPNREKSRVSLHVKRVFVTDNCEELVPAWLRFVSGLVDSQDLPLNVSRETLQHNRQMGQIRKRVVKKVLDAMASMLKDRREDYVAYWNAFSTVLKEGLVTDDEHREALSKVCLFGTSQGAEPTTLAEYVERMGKEQQPIYFVTGTSRAAVEGGPHLEAARAKGLEVLLLTDPIDQWVVHHLTEFDGHALTALDRGDVDLGESTVEKTEREQKSKDLKPVLDAIQSGLDEHVKAVRLSSRLSESPAMLVTEGGDLTPQMEQILRASGQEVPQVKRVLELNPEHAIVQRLKTLHDLDPGGETFSELLELLHGQALLAEGSAPTDPGRFAKLVARLMAPGS